MIMVEARALDRTMDISQGGAATDAVPLDPITKKQNRSDIADLKNTGGRGAGSITAAHFIGEFAGDTPWVHLDIAATNMGRSVHDWEPTGATGVPTRALIQLAMDLGS